MRINITTFKAKGMMKLNFFFKKLFIGGKNISESIMPIIPGTACTKEKFNNPIVNMTNPNIQLVIF
jgi:hypothetical protein